MPAAVFEGNCSKLKAASSAWPHVAIRPHCKAHKTAEVAQLQLRLLGAKGVCCQKVRSMYCPCGTYAGMGT